MLSSRWTVKGAAVCAAIVVAVSLASCRLGGPSGASPNDDANNGNETEFDEQAAMNAAALDAWMDAVADRPPEYEPDRPTFTSELMQAAYEAGDITEDEHYLLRAQAAFAPDIFAERFRGEPDRHRDNTVLLREIRMRYDMLSAEAQAALHVLLSDEGVVNNPSY